MPFKQKITDEQFAEAFINCDGHLSQTARYIEKNYGVHYTPQAVDDRVNKFPELVDQVNRIYSNFCREQLKLLADDVTLDPHLRSKNYWNLLNYLLRLTILKHSVKHKMPEGVFDLNGYILRFPGNGVTAVDDKKTILEAINKKH